MLDMDKELLREINKIWLSLMYNKMMQVKTIYDRIAKSNLSINSLKDWKVRAQVEKFGYYDSAQELPDSTIGALEFLTELGYLEKRNDTIYKIGFFYEVYPYKPVVTPLGYVGISSPMTYHYETLTLDSKQYQAFDETAPSLKNQVSAGMHKHITKFDYGVNFSYDTTIYEVKDLYFDAIWIDCLEPEGKLTVELVEPFIQSSSKRDRKNWRKIREVDPELFLSDSKELGKLIDELEWKKRSIGCIIYNDKAYTIVPREIAQGRVEENDSMGIPRFLDKGVYSYENTRSRIFEDAVADYLQDKYQYALTARFKPCYLEGKEIDVFAEKGTKQKTYTICECKFRQNDSPITMDELRYFQQKIEKVKNIENKRGEAKFYFWFVTNIDDLENGLREYSKQVGIELMKAHLSGNWEKRSDWSVVNISAINSSQNPTIHQK